MVREGTDSWREGDRSPAGVLVANWLTTGRPLLFGYEVLWGANHSLGFHDDPSGNPHTPGRGLLLATAYAMQPPEVYKLLVPDVAFRTSDRESITPRCRAELLHDASLSDAISYGQTLLLNQIGSDGRIAGPVVFVADLAEHNDVLRARFADRPWYRLEMSAQTADRRPRLVRFK